MDLPAVLVIISSLILITTGYDTSNAFIGRLGRRSQQKIYDDFTGASAIKDPLAVKCYVYLPFQDKNLQSQDYIAPNQLHLIAGPKISKFCNDHSSFIITPENTIDFPTKTNIKKRSTQHYFVGRRRGQTQSQYLNFGSSNEPGKAEAEFTVDGSRAVVTGSSGMGQAQSQSGISDCGDCRTQEQTLHYGRPGGGGDFGAERYVPGSVGGLQPRPGESGTSGGGYETTPQRQQQGVQGPFGYNGRLTPEQGAAGRYPPGQTGGAVSGGYPGTQGQGATGRFPGAGGLPSGVTGVPQGQETGGRFPGAISGQTGLQGVSPQGPGGIFPSQGVDGRFPGTVSGQTGVPQGLDGSGTGRLPQSQSAGGGGGSERFPAVLPPGLSGTPQGPDSTGRFPLAQGVGGRIPGAISGQTGGLPPGVSGAQQGSGVVGGFPGTQGAGDRFPGALSGQPGLGGPPQGPSVADTGRFPGAQGVGGRFPGEISRQTGGFPPGVGGISQTPGTEGFPGVQGSGERFPGRADGGQGPIAPTYTPERQPGFYDGVRPSGGTGQFPSSIDQRLPEQTGTGPPGYYGQIQGQPDTRLNGRVPDRQGQFPAGPQQQFTPGGGGALSVTPQGQGRRGEFSGQFAGNYVPNDGQAGRFSGTFAGQYEGQPGARGQYDGQAILPQGGQYGPGRQPGSVQQGQLPGTPVAVVPSPGSQYLPPPPTGSQVLPDRGGQYPEGLAGQQGERGAPGTEFDGVRRPGQIDYSGGYAPGTDQGRVQISGPISSGGRYGPVTNGQIGVQSPGTVSTGGAYGPGYGPSTGGVGAGGIQPPGAVSSGGYGPGYGTAVGGQGGAGAQPPGTISTGGEYGPGYGPSAGAQEGVGAAGIQLPGTVSSGAYVPGSAAGGQGGVGGIGQVPGVISTGGEYGPSYGQGVGGFPGPTTTQQGGYGSETGGYPGQSGIAQYPPTSFRPDTGGAQYGPGAQGGRGATQFVPGRGGTQFLPGGGGGAQLGQFTPETQYGPTGGGSQYVPGRGGQYGGAPYGPNAVGPQQFPDQGIYSQPQQLGPGGQSIRQDQLYQGGVGEGGGRVSEDDSDSQAQSSVQQINNETQASASAQGTFAGGTAQSQVQGTYYGTGSFTASAGTSDGRRGAQTQISGGDAGVMSSAQGTGGLGQSQAQVLLSAETGQTTSNAQSGGYNHGTNSQVQANEKGGMADAQANGPGNTSSQAQIGFTPYSENDTDNQQTPFKGGGTASAQGGAYSGQTQSQITGKFRFGIKYTGSAQAQSGGSTAPGNATVFKPFTPFSFPNVTRQTVSSERKNFSTSVANRNLRQHTTTTLRYEGGDTDISTTTTTETPNEPEYYDDNDYAEYEDEDKHKIGTKSITQTSGNQKQHIVLDPLEDLDASVHQAHGNDDLKHGMILQPGQSIPGSSGYKIPQGFRGKVISLANGANTAAFGPNSQAQSVTLKPGSGRVFYQKPLYQVGSRTHLYNGNYGYGSGYTNQPMTYKLKSGKSLPNFVAVTKSETGLQDLYTGKRTPRVYYSQSSTCGYFTNTCVFNGKTKVCTPKPKTNPDGTPVIC